MTDSKKDFKLIVGLGNPEPRFYRTRHNVGRNFVDDMARELNLDFRERDNFACAKDPEHGLTLAYPLLYMNECGSTVAAAAKYARADASEILVVHDDLETDVGKYRFKESGSAGGHNGIKSIITALGTDEFTRLKIGIGRPESRDAELISKYVLGRMTENENASIQEAFAYAYKAIFNT